MFIYTSELSCLNGNYLYTSTVSNSSECVSRQEFESLKRDLHNWQNMTLTVIQNILDEPAEGNTEEISCECYVKISLYTADYCQDKIETLQRDMKSVKNKMDEDFSSMKNQCIYIYQYIHYTLTAWLIARV